ncbi:MAG: family 78 glycoside hydrolase catalytic domain, partial [Lachnospiraceae bacterium]|nr:family 78 glycoside hydrolase catalytic domain [Lachnospiraceae bacterium]
MTSITDFRVENLRAGCVTDSKHPHFCWRVDSDGRNVSVSQSKLTVNGWTCVTGDRLSADYEGETLKPFKEYKGMLSVTTDDGETAKSEISFSTGRLDTPWQGKWISDPQYIFREKGVSPVPMVFKKKFSLKKRPLLARIYITALGVYELRINNKKVGEDYFTPGFTSYSHNLQYQTYDVTDMLKTKEEGDNEIVVTVAGGWAVGSFVFTRKNRVNGDRQALLAELRISCEDGCEEIIGTDEDWEVTEEGPLRSADLYDGEEYDACVAAGSMVFRKAAYERLRLDPKIQAGYGAPVREHETLYPIDKKRVGNEIIYDFGQNFAGIVFFKVKGKKGQVITIRHAEVLHPDGTLNTDFLRTAKARIVYTCREGEQEYHPRFTYMGFRYISVTGIDEENITLYAKALYSD